MPKLTELEITNLLTQQPEWAFEAGALVRHWTFRDFSEAMVFVNQVAVLAEQADHHPDIDIRYNKVRLALVSHDANALTNRDSFLAIQISQIA